MGSLLSLPLAGLAVGLALLGQAMTAAVGTSLVRLRTERMALGADPRHFRQKYCQARRAASTASPVRCQSDFFWHSANGWQSLCQNNGQRMVFAERTYRVHWSCSLHLGALTLPLVRSVLSLRA